MSKGQYLSTLFAYVDLGTWNTHGFNDLCVGFYGIYHRLTSNLSRCKYTEQQNLSSVLFDNLRREMSDILKILPPKNEKFQIKIQIFFTFLLRT